MKKLLAVFVIAASLSACGSGNDNTNTTDSMNTMEGSGNSDATMQPGTDTSAMLDSTVNGTGTSTTPGTADTATTTRP